MADTKLSNLSSATALTGAESLYVVQGGTSKKTTVSDVTTAVVASLPTGMGVVRLYTPTSYTTVPSGTAVSTVSARIAIPSGGWNASCRGELRYEVGRTGSSTDTVSLSTYFGATGFTGSGATNRMTTAPAIAAAANARLSQSVQILGNLGDNSVLYATSQTNAVTPFTNATTTLRFTSATTAPSGAFDLTIQLTTGATDGAVVSNAYFIVYDPTGAAAITVKDEGSTLTSAATSIDFVGSNVTATNVSGAVTVTVSGGGSTTWQTYTPNVSNAVPIAMDYNSGPNVHLLAPVDDIQVVNLPLNLPDGGEMEIHLVGGDGSGSWTPVWDVATSATPGWKFLVSGVAPTAPVAGFLVPCYLKRKGAEYRVIVGTQEVTP